MWRTTSLTPAKVYLAPDAVADGDEDQAQADVFSRGAIAHHILTGRPPVTNPFDLPSRLREGNGPLLAGIMNGAGRWLEELVRVYADRNRPSIITIGGSTVVVCFRYRLRPDQELATHRSSHKS